MQPKRPVGGVLPPGKACKDNGKRNYCFRESFMKGKAPGFGQAREQRCVDGGGASVVCQKHLQMLLHLTLQCDLMALVNGVYIKLLLHYEWDWILLANEMVKRAMDCLRLGTTCAGCATAHGRWGAGSAGQEVAGGPCLAHCRPVLLAGGRRQCAKERGNPTTIGEIEWGKL